MTSGHGATTGTWDTNEPTIGTSTTTTVTTQTYVPTETQSTTTITTTTTSTYTTTNTVSTNTNPTWTGPTIDWNWNAAGSITILVLSVMATIGLPFLAYKVPTLGRFGASSTEGGLLQADYHVFEYLNGNPNPSAWETTRSWLYYFTYGFVKP